MTSNIISRPRIIRIRRCAFLKYFSQRSVDGEVARTSPPFICIIDVIEDVVDDVLRLNGGNVQLIGRYCFVHRNSIVLVEIPRCTLRAKVDLTSARSHRETTLGFDGPAFFHLTLGNKSKRVGAVFASGLLTLSQVGKIIGHILLAPLSLGVVVVRHNISGGISNSSLIISRGEVVCTFGLRHRSTFVDEQLLNRLAVVVLRGSSVGNLGGVEFLLVSAVFHGDERHRILVLNADSIDNGSGSRSPSPIVVVQLSILSRSFGIHQTLTGLRVTCGDFAVEDQVSA